MTWLQTIILGIVEGITEFLPISSTGHMIIVSSLMGINEDDFVKLFEVCIQLGAILSVVVLFWKKFFDFSRLDFYWKLLVAFLPAAVIGGLLHKKVDMLLESSTVVGASLLVGGIILLFVDHRNHCGADEFCLGSILAHNSDYAICPAPSADPACADRMNCSLA